MQTTTNYIGVDISKLTFDVAIKKEKEGYQHYKFDNNEQGFLELIKVMPPQAVVVMEASGPYFLRLAKFLVGKDISVSVMNPLVIRRFCQMRMSRAKTDKKDAIMIAEYGYTEKPQLWQAPQAHKITLQQMERVRSKLQGEHTALSNQLGSFYESGMLDKELESLIKKELAHKEKLMDELEEKIAEEHYASLLKELKSIPGIGQKTASCLAVICTSLDLT